MRTYPDFTWEHIVKACEAFSREVKRYSLAGTNMQGSIEEAQKAEALISVVQELQEHPQLETLVPALSLRFLRWFPAEDCYIGLDFEVSQSKYRIWAGGDITIEETVVPLEEAAETVYAYITKYRQD